MPANTGKKPIKSNELILISFGHGWLLNGPEIWPTSIPRTRQARKESCPFFTKKDIASQLSICLIFGQSPDHEAGSVYQTLGRSPDTACIRHRDRSDVVRDRIRPQRLGSTRARAPASCLYGYFAAMAALLVAAIWLVMRLVVKRRRSAMRNQRHQLNPSGKPT